MKTFNIYLADGRQLQIKSETIASFTDGSCIFKDSKNADMAIFPADKIAGIVDSEAVFHSPMVPPKKSGKF